MGKLGYGGKIFRQSLGMAKQRKALWLPPVLVILGIAGAVIVGSGAASELDSIFRRQNICVEILQSKEGRIPEAVSEVSHLFDANFCDVFESGNGHA